MLKYISILFFLILLLFVACTQNPRLHSVTNADFTVFVESTGYITDAEKFGWSFVQKTVNDFDVVRGATWRKPDAKNIALADYPVTQVSYNDALAYCEWSNTKIPTYEHYWELVKPDRRVIHIDANFLISADEANYIGNTWDITETWNDRKEIRLAGGSYLCNPKTCDGTNPNRELYVSPDTGNSNISFSVLLF